MSTEPDSPSPSTQAVPHGTDAPAGAQAPRWALYLQLIRWDRPAGWLLLLWPTLSALFLAQQGLPSWHLLVVFIGGTILMRSAGCCINDVADRKFDRHVKRTAERPVTSGLISVSEALALGAFLALAAFALALTTNAPTILLCLPALAVAVVYPYAKRVVSMPQAVLGVAFSFGIPMAYTAVRAVDEFTAPALFAALPWPAGALMLSNLFWVLAYDTEYAMVDRDDDVRIGMKTAAITLGRADVAAVMAFYLVHLASWSALGIWMGQGLAYQLGVVAAVAQALWHFRLIRDRSREGCFRAFRLNHWMGFTLWVGVVVDVCLR